MEKTSTTSSYRNMLDTLDERLTEQKHRHLWLFLYSSRHAQLQLQNPQSREDINWDESIQLVKDTLSLLKKFAPKKFRAAFITSERIAALLNEFCFGITYAFHRKHLSDGFIDIRFEEMLRDYNYFIDTLKPKDIITISKLHELTYKYGFAITELWLPIENSRAIMDALTKNKVRVDALYSIPSFVFVKKGNHPSGIQISISDYEYAINDPWDLLIYTEENGNLKKIRDKLSDLWNTPGKQFIGSPSDYKIALYVDRKKKQY